MSQDLMREQLRAYLAANPDTANAHVLVELIEGGGDLYARGDSKCHVTASGWILRPDLSETLLIEHAKYKVFTPAGGHVDPGETALEACLREVAEETGLHNLIILSQEIFDIDIHSIPASETKREPEHFHCDVRTAAIAPWSEQVDLNLEECLSSKWMKVASLLKCGDQSLERMARKTARFG